MEAADGALYQASIYKQRLEQQAGLREQPLLEAITRQDASWQLQISAHQNHKSESHSGDDWLGIGLGLQLLQSHQRLDC